MDTKSQNKIKRKFNRKFEDALDDAGLGHKTNREWAKEYGCPESAFSFFRSGVYEVIRKGFEDGHGLTF